MSSEPQAPPDWAREAFALTARELAAYATIVRRLFVAPKAFVRDWAGGADRYMNPLGVMATGITIYTIVATLIGFNTTVRSDQPFWLIALNGLAPYLNLVIVSALCHAMLGLAGSERRLRDSIGVVLYAGGTVGVVYRIVTWATAALLVRAYGMANIMDHAMPRSGRVVGAVVYAGGLIAYSSVVARALAALHRRSTWLIAPLLLMALYLAAILYGLFPVTGAVDLGPHLWLRLDKPRWILRLIPNLSV